MLWPARQQPNLLQSIFILKSCWEKLSHQYLHLCIRSKAFVWRAESGSGGKLPCPVLVLSVLLAIPRCPGPQQGREEGQENSNNLPPSVPAVSFPSCTAIIVPMVYSTWDQPWSSRSCYLSWFCAPFLSVSDCHRHGAALLRCAMMDWGECFPLKLAVSCAFITEPDFAAHVWEESSSHFTVICIKHQSFRNGKQSFNVSLLALVTTDNCSAKQSTACSHSLQFLYQSFLYIKLPLYANHHMHSLAKKRWW